jgi:hypothetical protein
MQTAYHVARLGHLVGTGRMVYGARSATAVLQPPTWGPEPVIRPPSADDELQPSPAELIEPILTEPMPDEDPALIARESALIGRQLTLTQEHLNGSHLEPRADCWRCERDRRVT